MDTSNGVSAPTEVENASQKKSVWDRSWLYVIFLILFYPFGLILVWVRAPWKKSDKSLVSIIFAGLFIFQIWIALVAIGAAFSALFDPNFSADLEKTFRQDTPSGLSSQSLSTRVDDRTYTINNAQLFSFIGYEGARYIAQEGAALLVVEYSIKNNSNSPMSLRGDPNTDLLISDGSGRSFSFSTPAQVALCTVASQYMMSGMQTSIQPGLKADFAAVFEIPEVSLQTSLMLKIRHNGYTGEIRLN